MALRTVGITPGSGDGVQFDGGNQVVKLAYGAEGASTLLDEEPATSALQTTANTKLDDIATALADVATETAQTSANTKLDTIVTALANLLTELQAKTEPANTQAVSAASLPLPTGAATEATLASIDAKTPSLVTSVPANNSSAPPTRMVGQDIWNCSFASVGASVLSSDFTTPVVGSGVGYSQASGSLLITTGTSTNAEFLTRSVQSWRGSMRMRFSLVASQRIANQNLQVTLADLIGSALTYNIVSTVLVDVSLTAHGYTAQNVGQFINLGGITGAAGVPGRYAIASIPDANTIRFTVAGWPASGSGTLTLFGWNYVRNLVTGTTATNIAFDGQRRGWATGDTTATINTTASPGTIIQNDLNGRDAFLMDQLRATSTTPTFTTRSSRYENLPDDDAVLYVFIWSYNGTSAPASTTTWTLGFVSVEKFANIPVYLQGARANGAANPIPVAFPSAQSVTATGVAGAAAHDAAISGNPLRGAGRALTANYTPVATGDTADLITTLVGALIQKPYSIPELEWTGIDSITNTTTATQLKNATASNKNYVTGLTIGHATLAAAGEIQLRTTPVASTTATIASNTLVMAATYNWKVGDLVYVTASTVTGLSAGSYYYILTVSAANLTFSATRGGSTLAISGTTVSATLAKILFRTQLQTTALPLTDLAFADPLDGGTNQAIEMCTPVAITTGRIDFNVRGHVAP
jgi:hypothetical protein